MRPAAAVADPEIPAGVARSGPSVLVHLASGIGNIVLATPLLITLDRNGYAVHVLVEGDYPETAELLTGWSAVRTVYGGTLGPPPARDYDIRIAAIPPFYWGTRFRGLTGPNSVARPPDALFYRDEQAYYLAFAAALGCRIDDPPPYFLPCVPDTRYDVTAATLVLAPGCKGGEMAAKRWPHFARLSELFDDVVVVGTADDLRRSDGTGICFPTHVRLLVGKLSLRETASVLAASGVVIANDSGLGHAAAAAGTPTVLLFGPTPDRTLGRLPPNARIMRAGLACEPCWFGRRFAACARRIECLDRLALEAVAAAAVELWASAAGMRNRGKSA
jgi:ADP-heptose:LPS heptosyltransferase